MKKVKVKGEKDFLNYTGDETVIGELPLQITVSGNG